jgi:hypothetical protein
MQKSGDDDRPGLASGVSGSGDATTAAKLRREAVVNVQPR